MANYMNHTGKIFGHFLVKRLAVGADMVMWPVWKRMWANHPAYNPACGVKILKFKGRHKYWFCVCIICGKKDIIRADYLQKSKTCIHGTEKKGRNLWLIS